MSNSANPLSEFWPTDGQDSTPAVAIVDGKGYSRRGLEEFADHDSMQVTTILPFHILDFTPEGKRELTEWANFSAANGRPWFSEEERDRYGAFWFPKRPDPDVLLEPRVGQCWPYDEDGAFPNGCPNPPVAIINGFSGPGWVPWCQEHFNAQAAHDLGAIIWRPLRVYLNELDYILWEGLQAR